MDLSTIHTPWPTPTTNTHHINSVNMTLAGPMVFHENPKTLIQPGCPMESARIKPCILPVEVHWWPVPGTNTHPHTGPHLPHI